MLYLSVLPSTTLHVLEPVERYFDLLTEPICAFLLPPFGDVDVRERGI